MSELIAIRYSCGHSFISNLKSSWKHSRFYLAAATRLLAVTPYATPMIAMIIAATAIQVLSDAAADGALEVALELAVVDRADVPIICTEK